MAEKEMKYYRIPDKDWFRIHFVRPRFKGNIEMCCSTWLMNVAEYPNVHAASIVSVIIMP